MTPPVHYPRGEGEEQRVSFLNRLSMAAVHTAIAPTPKDDQREHPGQHL